MKYFKILILLLTFSFILHEGFKLFKERQFYYYTGIVSKGQIDSYKIYKIYSAEAYVVFIQFENNNPNILQEMLKSNEMYLYFDKAKSNYKKEMGLIPPEFLIKLGWIKLSDSKNLKMYIQSKLEKTSKGWAIKRDLSCDGNTIYLEYSEIR